MACPDCGSAAGDFRFVTSVETHGLDCGPYETFNEEFIVCLACGGRFDLREWDGTPEALWPHDEGNSLGRDWEVNSLPCSTLPPELNQPAAPSQCRLIVPDPAHR
jgi:hypothetical protein